MKEETLKKIIELADGFEWEKTIYSDTKNITAKVRYNHNGMEPISNWIMITIVHRWILYPLLLQRAIEGINNKAIKDSHNITIKQFAYDIIVDCGSISSHSIRYPFIDFNWTVDHAKEQALKYILE